MNTDKTKKKSKMSTTKKDTGKKKLQELLAKVEVLDLELKEARENALKAYAESENFKKRKEQEKEDFLKFSNEKIIVELLPVMDSFDMAVLHAKDIEVKDHKSMLEGFLLIQKQLHALLEKKGVEKIEALNTQFDPNLHQAVGQAESKDVPSNTVIKEMQPGYKLNERVIRPAMVVVSK